MAPTPSNITTSSSLSYVVVKQISRPMTFMSSLNVSGTFTCNTINALNSTFPTTYLQQQQLY